MTDIRTYVWVSFRYGLLGGILTILLFFILILLDINPLVANKTLDFGFIIIPIIVFFSIREFRDLNNNGGLKFWQGMTVGFFTYVFLALVSSLTLWAILAFSGGELLREYIIDRSALWVENKEAILNSVSEEVYKNTLEDLQTIEPYVLAADDFLKKIFTGLFITIIISVFLRR